MCFIVQTFILDPNIPIGTLTCLWKILECVLDLCLLLFIGDQILSCGILRIQLLPSNVMLATSTGKQAFIEPFEFYSESGAP